MIKVYLVTTVSGSQIIIHVSTIVAINSLGSGSIVYRDGQPPLECTDSLPTFVHGYGLFTAVRATGGIVLINYNKILQCQSADNNRTTIIFEDKKVEPITITFTKEIVLSTINTREANAKFVPRNIGELVYFAAGAIPEKWLICDGATYNKADYQDLYDIIGDNYTDVPNEFTFDVPDFSAEPKVMAIYAGV